MGCGGYAWRCRSLRGPYGCDRQFHVGSGGNYCANSVGRDATAPSSGHPGWPLCLIGVAVLGNYILLKNDKNHFLW